VIYLAVVGLKRVISSPKTTVTDSFVIATDFHLHESQSLRNSINTLVRTNPPAIVCRIVVQTSKLVD